MARRRAECEATDVAAVLAKRQRTDVSQDERLLTRLEREVLKNWEMKQEKLAVLEIRVEEIVFLLKDLAPLCINDDWKLTRNVFLDRQTHRKLASTSYKTFVNAMYISM